jgi:hypothetical protein
MHFPTRGHRAWWAWHCLPRDDRGQPPTLRSLEKKAGLSNNDLSRLVWDWYVRPSWEKMQRFAVALGTTAEWLEREEGPRPLSAWHVPPRPLPPPGKVRRKPTSGPMKSVKPAAK